MYILEPKYIFTNGEVLQNKAVLFDKKILAVDNKETILKAYPKAEEIPLKEHSCLMPGLVNTHVHLEFSANKSTLKYGHFMPWLHSVIENREELMDACDDALMKKQCHKMLQNGITSFGAISSNGFDLKACVAAKQKVVYFNEVIGSAPSAVDALLADFTSRLETSKDYASERFFPSVAIHSAYSVHPILAKRALSMAKEENMRVSAHLLESPEERQWLEENAGSFLEFFKSFFGVERSVNTIEGFLALFDDVPTLFAHFVQASKQEQERLKEKGHTIAHCPISNRLLGNGALALDAYDTQNLSLGTDGLSSNYTLDLFEEMRAALFMQTNSPLQALATKLLVMATKSGADALALNCGEIKAGKAADMLVFNVEETFQQTQDLALHLILQNYEKTHLFIDGERHV